MKALIHTSLLLMTLLATPLVAAPQWEIAPGPGAISEHTMVRDSANDRMIVFGGLVNGVLSNRTLAYYPEVGVFREIFADGIAPSPRREALAVYDAKRERMIVFGGTSATGYTNDAFALYLTPGAERWKPLAADDEVLPQARTHGVMVLDEANDRVILHGGFSSPYVLTDVWALRLSEGMESWGGAPLVTTGSSGAVATGDAAIYDRKRQRMIVFRGYHSALVELSLDRAPTWKTLAIVNGPVNSRLYPAAALDSLRHRMIVQGGLDGAVALTETLSIDLDTLVCKQLAAEPYSTGRFWHAAAYDEVRDYFIMVGGKDGPRVQNASVGLLQGEIDAPELLAPADGEQVEGPRMELVWAPAKGASDYVVELIRADGGDTPTRCEIMINGTVATVIFYDQEELDRFGTVTYVWRVMGYSKFGQGEFSQYGLFVHTAPAIDEVAPEDNDPAAPGDGADPTLEDSGASGSDDMALADIDNRSVLDLNLQPAGQGEVAGRERTDNAAGCVGGNAGEGLSLALLALVILGVGLRTVRKARNA